MGKNAPSGRCLFPAALRILGLWAGLGLACSESAEAPAEDGVPCTSNETCASGTCLLALPAPVCGTPCTLNADCGPQRACAPLAKVAAAPIFACRPVEGRQGFDAPCQTGDDCASGLCHQSRCTARCMTCEGKFACEPTELETSIGALNTEVCVPRLARSDLIFGPITTTDEGGSAPVTFEVPPDTAGFVVIVTDTDGLRVAVTRLVDPNGTVWVDTKDDLPEPNPGPSYIQVTSLLVPAADGAPPEPGTWTLEAGTFDPAVFNDLVPMAADIDTVEIVFEPGLETGGALDLSIGLAPGLDVDTSTDAPFLSAILDQIEARLLEPASLTLGRVVTFDLPPMHDRVENGDETRQICRTYSQGGDRGVAVNLMIVVDLEYTSGHAGGIPGPPGIFQTNGSCIVAEFLRNRDSTGVLVTHEIGHFLGLHHTTELDGRADPISDTPVCASGTAVARCPDYQNLMFPRFPLDRPLTLTPGQIEVLRNNPMLWER